MALFSPLVYQQKKLSLGEFFVFEIAELLLHCGAHACQSSPVDSDGVGGGSSGSRIHSVLIGSRVPLGWLATESELWLMVQPGKGPMLGLSANWIRIEASHNQLDLAGRLCWCQRRNAGTPSLKTSASLKLGNAKILQC